MGITFSSSGLIIQPRATSLELTVGTVGVWWRRNGRPSGTQMEIFGKHSSTGSFEGWAFYLENTAGANQDTLNVYGKDVGGGIKFSIKNTTATAFDGTWHLASVNLQIASGVPIDLYYDGGNKTSANTSGTWDMGGASNDLRLAKSNDTFWQAFDGSLAHAFVYNEILTDAEHRALACGVSPLSIRPHALVFYLPMQHPNFLFNSVRGTLSEPTTSGTLTQATYDNPLAPINSGFLFDRDWWSTDLGVKPRVPHFNPIRSARRRA